MAELITPCAFLAHLASTLGMVGLIWFVQVVHYPLFSSVDRHTFPSFERRHVALTTWVVAPLMFVEAVSSAWLVWHRPAFIHQSTIYWGALWLGIAWVSTALLQVPCHKLLRNHYDSQVHRRLVATNWIRTAAWSIRGGLVLSMTAGAI